MTQKPKNQPGDHVRFLDPHIEYNLLDRFQRGEQIAVTVLVSYYLWFIKRLARAYTPKEAKEKECLRRWNRVLDIFQECASTIPLLVDECFLEYVLNAVDKEFNVERKKRLAKMRDAVATRKIEDAPSLDMPIREESDITFGDMTGGDVGLRPDDALWHTQLVSAFDTWCTSLDPLNAKIVRMMHGEREHSLSEVAAALNLPQARVQQHYKKALRQLRAIVPKDFQHSG